MKTFLSLMLLFVTIGYSAELINENFESISASGAPLATGWASSNAQTWILTGYGHESDKYAGWDEVEPTKTHWIQTKKVTNPGVLKFWICTYDNTTSALSVKVQVSADSINWVDKATYTKNAPGAGPDLSVDFAEKTIPINLSGDFYIRWISENPTKNGFYLDDILLNGAPSSITSVKNVAEKNELKYLLMNSYPNPFNPTATISYTIPNMGASSVVLLKIYDITGREVSTLVNEKQNAGNYNIKFNAQNYTSGIYLAKLNVNGLTKTIKMSLLK